MQGLGAGGARQRSTRGFQQRPDYLEIEWGVSVRPIGSFAHAQRFPLCSRLFLLILSSKSSTQWPDHSATALGPVFQELLCCSSTPRAPPPCATMQHVTGVVRTNSEEVTTKENSPALNQGARPLSASRPVTDLSAVSSDALKLLFQEQKRWAGGGGRVAARGVASTTWVAVVGECPWCDHLPLLVG